VHPGDRPPARVGRSHPDLRLPRLRALRGACPDRLRRPLRLRHLIADHRTGSLQMVNILAADENPLIPPLGEIIIGIIAFSVVVIVMMRLVAPRFEQVFRARREAIEGGIERAEAMQAEAREALERYRAQLAEARTEAAQIRDKARAEGEQILAELRAQAQEESARIAARGEEPL